MKCVQCQTGPARLHILYGEALASSAYGGFTFCDVECMYAYLTDPKNMAAMVESTATTVRRKLRSV